MIRKFLLLFFLFFLSSAFAFAQNEAQKEGPDIFAVVKDAKGDILEGYLRAQPEKVTVSSQDNQEKMTPLKYIKSITLEKIKEERPAGLDPKQEARYSVRLENSQEIYALRKKYAFSFNTNVGVVTRSIDPEAINQILSRDILQGQALNPDQDYPFIQGESIVFSLEFKF